MAFSLGVSLLCATRTQVTFVLTMKIHKWCLSNIVQMSLKTRDKAGCGSGRAYTTLPKKYSLVCLHRRVNLSNIPSHEFFNEDVLSLIHLVNTLCFSWQTVCSPRAAV